MRISLFVLLFSVFSVFGLVAKYEVPNPENAKLFMQEVIDDGQINIPKKKSSQENYNYFKGGVLYKEVDLSILNEGKLKFLDLVFEFATSEINLELNNEQAANLCKQSSFLPPCIAYL